MMDAIASAAMSMKSAQIASDYATALTKKAMDSQEIALETITEMLPQQTIPKGQYIDTYA